LRFLLPRAYKVPCWSFAFSPHRLTSPNSPGRVGSCHLPGFFEMFGRVCGYGSSRRPEYSFPRPPRLQETQAAISLCTAHCGCGNSPEVPPCFLIGFSFDFFFRARELSSRVNPFSLPVIPALGVFSSPVGVSLEPPPLPGSPAFGSCMAVLGVARLVPAFSLLRFCAFRPGSDLHATHSTQAILFFVCLCPPPPFLPH